MIALARKQTGKAVEYFSQAVQIDRGYADGYNNLGRAWTEEERLDKALPAFRRALELAPDNALFHVNFGVALGRAGQLQEARSQFERSLAIDPSLEWARQSLRILDQMERSAIRR